VRWARNVEGPMCSQRMREREDPRPTSYGNCFSYDTDILRGRGGKDLSHFGCECLSNFYSFFRRLGGVADYGMRNSYGNQPKDGSTAQRYDPHNSAAQSSSDACDDHKWMVLPSSG
jgi:hypothetical protein